MMALLHKYFCLAYMKREREREKVKGLEKLE